MLMAPATLPKTKRPGTGAGALIFQAVRAAFRAFSSEVETGSREENATKQESRAPALIPSKPERL
jgi:hypothetical protein